MNLEFYLSLLAWISPELLVVFTGLAVMSADLLLPNTARNKTFFGLLCLLFVWLGMGVPQLQWPLLAMAAVCAILMLPDTLSNKLSYASILGLAAALALDRWFVLPMLLTEGPAAPPLLYLSPFTAFVKDAILVASALTVILYHQRKGLSQVNPGEFLSLLLFSVSGMMFLVSSNDLMMVFLSMEFISIIAYVLVGYIREDEKSGEAAVKFYLIGAFSSGVMVYGMSLIYGLLGTTSITEMGRQLTEHPELATTLLRVSVLFLLVGLGFKLAMVPFHSWLPDAMEGGPTPVAAFISVAPKAAGVAILLRIFGEAFPLSKIQMVGLLSVLAIATMTFGNLMAIPQRNIKRLLAYSSIGHIGYILIGVIAANEYGVTGVLVYILAYIFMNLGAFACVVAVSNRVGSDEIEDYAGLAQRSLPIALLMVVFLLSLGGLPPTAGFIGKWYIFGSAIQAHHDGHSWWFLVLAVAGVLNSVVAIYYYFRLPYQMFFQEPRENTGVEGSRLLWLGMGISAAMVLLVGMLPSQVIDAAKAAAKLLNL